MVSHLALFRIKATLTDHFKALKVELDQERLKIQHQADKLHMHEKELIIAKEELRKKELEISSQTQDVKIATENKYRVMFLRTNDSVFAVLLFIIFTSFYWKKSFKLRWKRQENAPKLRAN